MQLKTPASISSVYSPLPTSSQSSMLLHRHAAVWNTAYCYAAASPCCCTIMLLSGILLIAMLLNTAMLLHRTPWTTCHSLLPVLALHTVVWFVQCAAHCVVVPVFCLIGLLTVHIDQVRRHDKHSFRCGRGTMPHPMPHYPSHHASHHASLPLTPADPSECLLDYSSWMQHHTCHALLVFTPHSGCSGRSVP